MKKLILFAPLLVFLLGHFLLYTPLAFYGGLLIALGLLMLMVDILTTRYALLKTKRSEKCKSSISLQKQPRL